jgi:nucleoside-diphosphate-sugar epimerase
MSYVDNTSLGLLLAAARPAAAGETYWIADPPPYSMNEIVGTVESVLEDDFGIQVAHNRARLPSVASEVAYVVDGAIQRTGFYEQRVRAERDEQDDRVLGRQGAQGARLPAGAASCGRA